MTEVFLKVLNPGITVGWIVLMVLFLRLLFKKAPKWINCLLWGIVALRLVLPFSFESVFSLIPSAEVIPQGILTAHTPAIQSGIPAVNGAVNPLFAEYFTPGGSGLKQIISVASVVWLAGLVLILLCGMVSYGRVRWQVRASVEYRKNVYACDDVVSPFILGLFCPRIYIPSGMDEEQLQYVIAHENAHIRRKDHWWKPLAFLLLAVYWFQPLLWLAYVLLCRDIEQACDEKVIAGLDNAGKKGYLEALVACSVHRRMILACPVAFGEVSVTARIKGVLNYRKPAFWLIIASVVVCAVTAVCFLTNPSPCIHEYHREITSEATCSQMGVETFTCHLCQYSYTEPVGLLAHAYNEGTVVEEPTCVREGSKELTCADCGAVQTEEMKKIDHTAGELTFIKEPNCTEKGERSAVCTVCQGVFVVEIIETNDVHDMQETVLIEATCSTPGEGINTCTRCGHSESCTYKTLEHNYENGVYLAGKCNVEAVQQKICADCGHERWVTLSKSTEHRWMYVGNTGAMRCWDCGIFRYDSATTSTSSNTSLFGSCVYQNTSTSLFPAISIFP